ncbi:MAG: OB-fold nucleic acid binding domain-containing protein, partial [Leifsonia sp.]
MTSPSADALPGGQAGGLDAPLAKVVGPRTAAPLAKAFGMRTVGDLLSHYPRRYARRGELTALDRLPLDENVTIVAEVREVRGRSMKARRGSILEVSISDGSGILTLTFFNQAWREKELRPGVRGVFAGKVTAYRGALQLAHPDYDLFDDDSVALSGDPAEGLRWAEMPIPIYPATASFSSWNIAKAVAIALDGLPAVGDPVPGDVRRSRGLVDHARALELVHRPQTDSDWRRAR